MRRPKGVLLPPIHQRRLRRGDLHRALRAAVLDGVLPPGERLPSTRQAANDYGVPRGTFVATRMANLSAPAKTKPGRRNSAGQSHRGMSVAANAACREPEVLRPFNAGVADTGEFPWELWCRLQTRAARMLGRSSLTFADPRGLPRLREAVARYLAQFRGIRCEPAQVVIFNSAQ